MTRSMTGFGSAKATIGREEVQVELRAVNHKFCEVKARLPRELAPLEHTIVKQIKDRLSRGAVDLSVKRSGSSEAGVAPRLDLELARAYATALTQLAMATGVGGKVELSHLATLPGVMRLEEPAIDLEAAQAALIGATERALTGLINMRELEGKALVADLLQRLAHIEQLASEIRARGPRIVEEYQKRFTERVAALSAGTAADPQRLAQEVALWAERTDVAEELTRLDSHLAQFRGLLEQSEPSGRKLDFLIQEMHREVNTTGSKSQHPDVSARIVELKAELERVREQVQNVE